MENCLGSEAKESEITTQSSFVSRRTERGLYGYRCIETSTSDSISYEL